MNKSPRVRPARPNRTVSILGTGSYVPPRIVTNSELEQFVETSDEWIRTRTGIRERRFAEKDEHTSHMAAKAGLMALEQAGLTVADLDMIIVATVTPDTMFPSTACHVQRLIGATKAACFDLSAACSGFLYGVEVAQQFISTHTYDNVLVVGADKLSSIMDWTDRNTCVLFGDGAGAAVLGHRGADHGVITTYMASDGNFGDILHMPGGGCAAPITRENAHLKLNTLKMNGRETFKQAVRSMGDAANRAISEAGLEINDIKCIIPHQANMRIIESLSDRLSVPMEKFHINLDRYGNTSAAAVAIALDEAAREGRFAKGEFILLVVFGGGLTYASSVIEW